MQRTDSSRFIAKLLRPLPRATTPAAPTTPPELPKQVLSRMAQQSIRGLDATSPANAYPVPGTAELASVKLDPAQVSESRLFRLLKGSTTVSPPAKAPSSAPEFTGETSAIEFDYTGSTPTPSTPPPEPVLPPKSPAISAPRSIETISQSRARAMGQPEVAEKLPTSSLARAPRKSAPARVEAPPGDATVHYGEGVDDIFDQVWVNVQRRLAGSGQEDDSADEFSHIRHQNMQSIIVTSWSEDEGSSTTALGLAGRAGGTLPGRVCLVDADLHGRGLTKASGCEDRRGLYELLTGDVDLDSVLVQSRTSDFAFLPSGRKGDGEGWADDAKLQHVIRTLEERFRYVFYDSSSLKRGVEAYRFGRFVVNAILVVRAGVTRRQTVLRAVDQLKLHGMSLLGTVLNHRVDVIPNWLYPYV